jgi:hypothetical protein
MREGRKKRRGKATPSDGFDDLMVAAPPAVSDGESAV